LKDQVWEDPLLRSGIIVKDILTNKSTEYDSISSAARALVIKKSAISMYFSRNQQKPCKGKYLFKKI